MATTTTTLTLDDFRAAYPVGRSFHTGRYGWRRAAGCLNLNACRFRTEAEAEADRDGHYEAYRRHPGDFSR
jgi:hypothetical protein